jgi:hypothetical protein
MAKNENKNVEGQENPTNAQKMGAMVGSFWTKVKSFDYKNMSNYQFMCVGFLIGILMVGGLLTYKVYTDPENFRQDAVKAAKTGTVEITVSGKSLDVVYTTSKTTESWNNLSTEQAVKVIRGLNPANVKINAKEWPLIGTTDSTKLTIQQIRQQL